MQPRQQPLSAPGPRGPRPVAPLLVSLLWFALQGAGAAPAGLGWLGWLGEPAEPHNPGWLDYGTLPRSLLPDGILEQAAQVAVHFLNFRVGSPSALRVLSVLHEGRAWIHPMKEYHAEVVFITNRYNPEEGKEEPMGKCSAQVTFKKKKPRPAVSVTCERLIEKSRRQQEDYLLYKHLKQLKVPVGAVSIPDSHGYVDPSLRPVADLAFLGSSYVMWEKTTDVLQYHLAQLTSVNQWKTDDDAIDFDYTVLLHEFSTQEIIPCRIHLVWYPGKPLKVKYHCQRQETPDETSGTEEGSAVAPTELSNF